jgi:hypothetical protein
VGQILRLHLRLLTFRATESELRSLDLRHLAWGLLCTWIVGVGRWWDDPTAREIQKVGVGSLAYVAALAGLLWVIVGLLRPRHWSPVGLLAFVALSSLPGLLYAIPAELWMPPKTAASLNLWFLGIVALWRVALLLFFLIRYAGLDAGTAVIAGAVPINAVIVTLTILNIQETVVSAMGGLRIDMRGGPFYEALLDFSVLSVLGSFLLVPIYLFMVVSAWLPRRKANAEASAVEGSDEA